MTLAEENKLLKEKVEALQEKVSDLQSHLIKLYEDIARERLNNTPKNWVILVDSPKKKGTEE